MLFPLDCQVADEQRSADSKAGSTGRVAPQVSMHDLPLRTKGIFTLRTGRRLPRISTVS